MNILHNVPLDSYSTMRLGGQAAYLTDINNTAELTEALSWASSQQLPTVMIGGGSNIIWSDRGFPGLVMVNKIKRFETFNEDDDNLYITVGAGEIWDEVVGRVVELGYSGLEELSLIPGLAGAAPIQNIGAYGNEIAKTLVSVETYDTEANKLITIPNFDCGFAYRTSRFKTTDRGRFFISAMTLHVTKLTPEPPFYASLQGYFDLHGITSYTPQVIRNAVIAVRSAKLPNPQTVANVGSFFHNPVITRQQLNAILEQHPKLESWPSAWKWELPDGQVKVAAGALLEYAGLKGVHDEQTGMATWPTQALVFINEHARNTADLLNFKQKIVTKIQELFNITLEQEPELIG